MEELTLLKDFAIIMVVAGAVTLLFRRLRQPVILGYLITGVLIGPHTLPVPPVEDVHTINMLVDLGLVLLLFVMGLEFSWDKIRQVGLSVLVIGVIEISTMIYLGYGLGRLMGWSPTDAIFLGTALHISSSAIIVKILRDMGKLKLQSSKFIVGILVVEDFAAIAIVTLLSGIATTGAASLANIGSLVLRLVIFIVASLVFGTILVPRIISFTHRFHSREALLITSLGLCFAMALVGKYLELSTAAGAFLMGALIGDTEGSEVILDTIASVRDMFAALFFVGIGMLIDITQFRDFIIPAVVVSSVFILGKIISNTAATFISGHDGRTSLEVGMSMPQMGEFSLVITKVGVDRGVITAPLYPVIALTTALTSLTTPYIMRSVDSVASFLDRRSPGLWKILVSRLADWLQALRTTFTRSNAVSLVIRDSIKTIMVNLLIVMIIIGVGTFGLNYIDELTLLSGIRADVIGLLSSFLLLVLCVPSFVIIWRNVRSLVDEAVENILLRRLSAKRWGAKTLRIILRDTITISLAIFTGMWFIPFIIGLFHIGFIALAIPVLLLAIIIYLVLRLFFDIHGQLERTFRRTLLGEEYMSTSQTATLLGTHQDIVAKLARKMKLPAVKIRHRWYVDKAKAEKLKETLKASEEDYDTAEDLDSDTTNGEDTGRT
ncbi:MAG: cation:proton antiporter [Chloroflexota bacterium]